MLMFTVEFNQAQVTLAQGNRNGIINLNNQKDLFMRYLLTVLVSLSLIACGSPDKNTPPEVTEQQRQELVDYLKSDQEPTIKDAMFDTDKQLKVSVVDDGSNRNGFAEYVCSAINERFDSDGYMVTVYDAKKIVQGKWDRLGQAMCK